MPQAPDPRPEGLDLSNWRTPPFSQWAFRNAKEIIPAAMVERGDGQPMPLPRASRALEGFALPWGDGSPLTLDEVFETTAGDGMVILKDGEIVFETYAHGLTAQTPHILMSATKAVIGLLAGVLQESGDLDIDAAVSDYVPEIAATAYAGATVRQLMDMRTGVVLDAVQQAVYTAAAHWDPPPQGQAAGDLHGFLSAFTASVKPHGGPFSYISANTDLLGWVMERATGQPVATLLSRHLWRPLGAEQDGYILTDTKGAARCTGGLCITVRDFARLGQMVLQGGRRDGTEIVPGAWIEDILHHGDPEAWAKGEWGQFFGFAGSDIRYRAGWYGVNSAPQHLFAMGIHGQNLFVDRQSGVVIAKLSSQSSPSDYRAIPMTHLAAQAIFRLLTA